jgi:hypothetical protein
MTAAQASAAASSPDHAPLSASATPPGPPADTAPLLPLLRDLERLLEQDPLTTADVAAQVGPIEEDPGRGLPLKLRPRAPMLQKASLTRSLAGGELYLLRVAIAPEARPTILALRGIFGNDRPVVASLHGERETVFSPPSSGPKWSVAVIASLSPCWDPHSHDAPPPGPCEKLTAESRVETITFRRDPR